MEFPHTDGADTTGGVHTGGVYLNALHAEPSALDANTPVQPPHMSATHMGSGYLDTALHRYTAHTATPDTETDRFTLAPTWTRPPCPKRTAMCPDMTTTSPPGTTGAHQPDDHAGPHPHAQRHPTRAPADLRTPRSRSTMASDAPTGQPTGHVSDLDWLMSGLVQRVPHTTSAVLLSCDGLVKSVHGLDPDSADHMAALASGLYSLGRSAGVRFGDGGDVRQVVVELDSTLLFVTTAGSGTCLAVLAGREADAAVLGYEMAMLVKSVRPYLVTAPRQHAVDSPCDEALSVATAGDGPWLDDAAGRLVRPFTVSNGRTRPSVALDLLSQVMATGATPSATSDPSTRKLSTCAARPSRSPRSPPTSSCRPRSPRCCCRTSSTAGR